MKLSKLFVAVVLVLAACGSKPATTTTPKEGEGAEVALPDVPFDKLDHDQRIAFMKQKVMPAMKPIFQNHDAKAFEKFTCGTCHGAQAKEGHFDMPNPKLPKLNFNDMSKFKKEDLEWMEKEVLPTMGKILGLQLYSKENPNGFGCLACHTMEGQ
jgi:cytochrome c553